MRRSLPGAGTRQGAYLRLAALPVALLAVGLAVPFVAGDQVSGTALATGGAELSTDEGGIGTAETDEGFEFDTDAGADAGAGTGEATTTTTAAAASSGGSSGAATAGTGATAGSAAAPSRPLTATDTGVTPTGIRVGMLILDVGPVGKAGAAVAIDPEQQRAAWQSYVDEANAKGGINGRKIEPFYATYDVLSDDSARAACVKLTEDGKVFAVLGGFSKPASALCVLEEHRTPMVDYIGYHPDSLYRRSGGQLFTTFPTATRMMRNFVHELGRVGAIKGKKIGIVSDDQSDPGDETSPILARFLKEAGHEVVHRSVLAGSASSQVPVEVQQMRTKGVDFVILLSATLNSQSFTQAADSQGWRPGWAGSDWGTMNGDTTMKNAGATFDGAWGVTSTRNYEFRGNIPQNAPARECQATYERRSGRKLAPRGEAENSLSMNFCDTFRVFEAASRAAGPELTRARFANAVQNLGNWSFAAVGDGSFRPGKFDGTDQVRLQRWRVSCRCWTYVDAFHRSAA